MTIMMSDSLVGKLDPSNFIADGPGPVSDIFSAEISIGSQTFSCEIDKFKRSRNDTTILFFSSAELSSKLMKERYLLDVKIEHGESEIVSFSDVTDVNSEIEILFNSAGSHVQLTILPS